MKAYDAISAVYDRLNRDVDYPAFADFYEEIFRRNGEKPELVLDLGCGTGRMTMEMAARGYDMIGVDANADMLSRAFDRKMASGDRKTLFLLQDMRSFELYGTVGAVISTLDCINYLTDPADLLRCFSLVHNYLDPGGIFIFDVNTPYKFQNIYGDNAYILEDEDEHGACYCGWQNEYDPQSGICRFFLSVFSQGSDGRYSRSDEEQAERCYTRAQLEQALVDSGFGQIRFYGDTHCADPAKDCERWLISAVCEK